MQSARGPIPCDGGLAPTPPPDGIHQYGGGYTEYVARTGQEAPGLRN